MIAEYAVQNGQSDHAILSPFRFIFRVLKLSADEVNIMKRLKRKLPQHDRQSGKPFIQWASEIDRPNVLTRLETCQSKI